MAHFLCWNQNAHGDKKEQHKIKPMAQNIL
jgi:hypothetical protein